MSERFQSGGIGAMQELRPSEDLSLLHTYELRRLFEAETVSSLGLVERQALPMPEPESFRPISAPLSMETPAPGRDGSEPILPHTRTATNAIDPERVPHADADADALPESEVPRRDWLLQPEPMALVSPPQPYGDDPVRMRELLQWFADGRAASASVLVQRAAGDLVERVPVPVDTYRLRPIAGGQRTA